MATAAGSTSTACSSVSAAGTGRSVLAGVMNESPKPPPTGHLLKSTPGSQVASGGKSITATSIRRPIRT